MADGTRKRFAAGTKTAFAIDRINRSEAETSTRYAFISAVKEGEEEVEFGPNAELVSYGEGWKLQAVQGMLSRSTIPRPVLSRVVCNLLSSVFVQIL